jgi:hypothetical protein
MRLFLWRAWFARFLMNMGLSIVFPGYRITPYRDLKRASGVKRTSSLRTPRPRRNTLESNGKKGMQSVHLFKMLHKILYPRTWYLSPRGQ